MNFNFEFNLDLQKKLQLSQENKKPLNIKLGFDPTAPDLHLGHFVVLKEMKKLQDLGHNIIIIVGDFTASIGDPTGKNKTRPPLNKEDILNNAKTYTEQLFLVLDKYKTNIQFNSQWLSKITMEDIIKTVSSISINELLSRHDFKNRFESSIPIFMHEFLYPVMQGLDSVFINADVELGGNDQIFNLMLARELQKSKNLPTQAVCACPILVGLDGEKKMSKSLNNHIGLMDSPKDKFGKTMSIPDKAIDSWFTLLFDLSQNEILNIKNNNSNPRDQKILLAKKIVEIFHSKEIADNCEKDFNNTFSKKIININNCEEKNINITDFIKLSNLIKEIGFANSLNDANRKIEQAGVKINNNKVLDKNLIFDKEQEFLLQVGKLNFAKIKINKL